ncbi:hypothetical protein GCM10022243_59580 [Saccharothrix violaceirubra]|uniref:Uncharacterized protein n=1 Tax=Saccharothrix violaceirubra TaxID=413306 RepID=A0A7W7T482_9PSEU|nr:bacteriophage holin [Saccharothrix violaceirubra]MBB4964995.1 hypothetical protein [Saccharothrix violaceirubra]
MYYLATALSAFGVVFFAVIVAKIRARLRGLRSQAGRTSARMKDRIGLIRARSAALKVALAQRRTRNS